MFIKRLFCFFSAVTLVCPFMVLAQKTSKSSVPSSLQSDAPVSRMTERHPFMATLIQTYNTNPTLKAALRAQYVKAEALPSAQAGFRPNLTFEASTQRGFQDNQNRQPTRNRQEFTRYNSITTSHSGRLTLSQSLFAGGGTIAAINAAEAQIMALYSDFARIEQETLLASVQSYLTLWLRRSILSLNKKNVSVKEKTLEQARARLEVGELTLTDIAQAESELALAQSRKIVAESDVKQAEENYHRVVGETPPHNLPLPQEVSHFFELPADKVSFIKYARNNNPNTVSVRFLELAAKHNIDVAKAQLLPSLDLSGSVARNLVSDESREATNSRTNSGSIGLTLRVPLYQGGKNWSGFRGARQSATQAKLNVRDTERKVNEEAVQAWEKWKAAKNQIHHLTIQVDAARLSLEGTRQESLVGERTLLEVLEAENKVLEAETQLAQAQSDHLVQSYTLLSSLGHLTATALELPVEPYPLKTYVDTLRSTWIGTVSDPELQKG